MRSALQGGENGEVDPVLQVVQDFLPFLVHWAHPFAVEDEASPAENSHQWTKTFTFNGCTPFGLSGSHTLYLPRSSEGLVCGGSDQVGVVKGGGDSFGCHEATNVSHVSKHVGVDICAELFQKKVWEGLKTSYK